jgi:hypothetical protein
MKEVKIMYCKKCGIKISGDLNFCNFCGTRIPLQKEVQDENASLLLKQHNLKNIRPRFTLVGSALNAELLPISDVKQVRPWVRFWARMIDIIIVSIFGGLLVGIFIPRVLGWELFFTFITIISTILVEALLLSTWGMTPGKSLLQVYVRDPQGRKLHFSQAIKRCISVWTWGLGFGIPILSLIFLLLSYEHIQETAVAKWDIEGVSLVSHKEISIPKIGVVVSLFVGLIHLTGISGSRATCGNTRRDCSQEFKPQIVPQLLREKTW